MNSKNDGGTYGVIFGGEKGIEVPTISYGSTAQEQAHNLFAVLRKTDELGAKRAYVRCPEKRAWELPYTTGFFVRRHSRQ